MKKLLLLLLFFVVRPLSAQTALDSVKAVYAPFSISAVIIGNDSQALTNVHCYSVQLSNNSSHNVSLTEVTITANSINPSFKDSLVLNNAKLMDGDAQCGATLGTSVLGQNLFFSFVSPLIIYARSSVTLDLSGDLYGWGSYQFSLVGLNVTDAVTNEARTLLYGQNWGGEVIGKIINLVNTDHLSLAIHLYPETYDRDTIFVLPGESFYSSGYFRTASWNFIPDAIMSFHSGIIVNGISSFNNWNFVLPWTDSLVETGLLTTSLGVDNQSVVWTGNSSSQGINQANFGWLSGDNNLPLGGIAMVNYFVEATLYNSNSLPPQLITVGRQRVIKCIDGILGDVDGNGVVEDNDLAFIQQAYTSNGLSENYFYTPQGINFGRAAILFSYPTIVDMWLINVWLHNPNDPVVQGLGIGQLMSARTRPLAVAYSQAMVGNNLQINTQAYAVRVSTTLPSGKMWDSAVQVQNGKAEFSVPDAALKYKIEAVALPSQVTGVKSDAKNIPAKFSLNQNYPNPFNPTTTIGYSLPKAAPVSLKIYDILGREVANLVNEEKPAGSYQVNFDASKLASGTYIYRLTAGSFSQIKKMILLK